MNHKASDAMNPSAPTPVIIDKQLQALEDWLDTVMDRQGKISTS